MADTKDILAVDAGPRDAAADERPAAPRPGVAASVLPAVLMGALFAAAATLVETLFARFTGSYIAPSVTAMVLAFWTAVGAAAGLALAALLAPVMLAAPAARRAAMPAALTAAAFAATLLYMRPRYAGFDTLGGDILLNPWFLVAWSLVAGAVMAAVSSPRRGGVWTLTLAAFAVLLFCAGLSYYLWKPAAAYTLVVGPLALLAFVGALTQRMGLRALRIFAAGAVVALAVALFVTASLSGETPSEPIDLGFKPDPGAAAMLAGRPNVIVVTLDTTRADHTSVCGYPYDTTPGLKALARDSLLFPNAVAVDSWTLPSHASMFTGKYPREHGAHESAGRPTESIEKAEQSATPLAPSQVTLATLLSLKGYNTAAIVSNYTWLCRQFGLDQGFSYYHDLPRFLVFIPGGSPLYKRGLDAVDRMLSRNGKLLQPYYEARFITRKAQDWVRKNKDAPFFLFLNYMDPHYPYSAVAPFDRVHGEDVPYDMRLRQDPWQAVVGRYIATGEGLPPDLYRSLVNQYDGEIAYADHWLGRFIDDLKSQGLYDDALIIVTSDHGEFLGEHQLLDHGLDIWEGVVRVPLLVKYPRGARAGEVRNRRVSLVDVFATVLDAAAFPVPDVPSQPVDRSQRPAVVEDYRNDMYVKRYGRSYDRDRMAVYDGDYKLFRSTDGARALYDVLADPGETSDLLAGNPAAAARLDELLSQWQAGTPVFKPAAGPARKISPAALDALRSLGYIDGAPGP